MAVSRLTKLFPFCATLLLICTTVAAQDNMPGMKGMTHQKKITIKGSDRPDLIPDGEATRLVFANIANHPDCLGVTRLSRVDAKTAALIVGNYQKAFQKLLAAQPQGGPYDPTAQVRFINQADLLIKVTKSELADKLSADGYQILLDYVQAEKQHMTVNTITYGGAN